jgi:hypothetical protein
MVNFNKVNEIATEDATEGLHELGNDDFVNVFATLVHRRTKNLKEVNNLLDEVVNKISTSFTIIGK